MSSYTVWVGGTEVTDHYVDRDTADVQSGIAASP